MSPGSVLTLAGGSLFGPVLGTFVNLTGATLGATLAFLLSRYLASDWVEQKTGGRLKQLKDGVEGEGWRCGSAGRLLDDKAEAKVLINLLAPIVVDRAFDGGGTFYVVIVVASEAVLVP